MVPVRLELQNFLSYGTDAPALCFEDFDVACLSGGNGEGKSALLDAMTWAIWGEARKSSGKRKPDDELIRIGSRHMEVTFTFDLEETRYRVTRSFSRSATGKTTSSDLEFQLYAPEDNAFRPLTGSTQRETQSRIDDTLGIDYNTFINSAFLLQGRSDEFTNKSPSQRKEILVRILNLSRYEALEGKARDEWRAAKTEQERLEAEIERLQEAVAEVPQWRERREEVRAEIEAKQESLAELREKQNALTEKRAELEAKARERESLKESIEDLESRIGEQQEEHEGLKARITEADELLAEADEIESAYEDFQSLKAERDELDEKRDLHRGVEKQIEQAKATLQERTNEWERRLDRLTVERRGFKQNLDECESKLAKRASVETALREAQAARQQVGEMAAIRDKRQSLSHQQEEAERALVGARQQLQGELEALRDQIEDEQAAVDGLDEVESRLEELEEQKDRRDRLGDRLETLEAKGKRVAQNIQEQVGQLEARREEYDRETAELQRFREANGPTCPTCGTQLTPDHREEVESTLQSSIDELKSSIATQEEEIASLKSQRSELREEYVELRERRAGLEGVEETLATVREQQRALNETAERLDEHREQARTLKQTLERNAYGRSHRRRWQWCAQRLATLPFDPDQFESLKNEAAQVDRYTERLRELDELVGRRDELQRKIREHDQQIQSLRDQLDSGSAFGDLQERISELQQKLEDVDFDPERFREVRAALEEQGDAQERMADLKHARENRDEWKRKKQDIEDRIDTLEQQREENQERLRSVEEDLAEMESLSDEIAKVEEDVGTGEEELNDIQQTLGMLNERLQQAARDQESLEETKEKLESCKKDRTIYNHLRTAFGKHGIPSLIIEETLPEIEERANRILERLTNGRMHVQLETLKEKKSGGTKETLEIIITDEQGVPRPYETFSGGESFRVNFALRVALAQLLAERTGVRVRTLVIDEGFGTQDEEGIERLVEAIQSIRQDFAKILVITHLPRLKEAFPVRIEVEKDPAIGSTFEVVGG